jgi:hypothetical protein
MRCGGKNSKKEFLICMIKQTLPLLKRKWRKWHGYGRKMKNNLTSKILSDLDRGLQRAMGHGYPYVEWSLDTLAEKVFEVMVATTNPIEARNASIDVLNCLFQEQVREFHAKSTPTFWSWLTGTRVANEDIRLFHLYTYCEGLPRTGRMSWIPKGSRVGSLDTRPIKRTFLCYE